MLIWPVWIMVDCQTWLLHPVHLLVSASQNQPANSVFLSQQTSTSQSKPAQKPTSEQAARIYQELQTTTTFT